MLTEQDPDKLILCCSNFTGLNLSYMKGLYHGEKCACIHGQLKLSLFSESGWVCYYCPGWALPSSVPCDLTIRLQRLSVFLDLRIFPCTLLHFLYTNSILQTWTIPLPHTKQEQYCSHWFFSPVTILFHSIKALDILWVFNLHLQEL